MFVKPAPHPEDPEAQLSVRHPRTHAFLNPVGEDVPDTAFWLRRLAHGDVVEATRPVPAAEPAVPAEAEPAPAATTEPAAAGPAATSEQGA